MVSLSPLDIQQNVLLASYSSFKVGGLAQYFCQIREKKDLLTAIKFAKENALPLFFLGGGSNILFSEKGFYGLVLQMQNSTIEELSPGIFSVGVGVKNAEFYAFAKKRNRDFSSFLTIPGTIGGAVAGNAGVPSAELSDYFLSAEIYDVSADAFRIVPKEFFQFSYRHTFFHDRSELRGKILIWSAKLFLPKKSVEEIRNLAKQAVLMRRQKQPWGKTGGSFFKNPKEGAAGYFLDQAGMKGERIGDAFFSEKHANFMMNADSASQADILRLARKGAEMVKKKFGVDLHAEVRILDEWGKEIQLETC